MLQDCTNVDGTLRPGNLRQNWWAAFSQCFADVCLRVHLWVWEDHVGGIETTQEVRYFHRGCDRVVDGEVRQPSPIHRPPVGRICQEHLLCLKEKFNIIWAAVIWNPNTSHLRKSSRRDRSPRALPDQCWSDAEACWSRWACSRYLRRTHTPGANRRNTQGCRLHLWLLNVRHHPTRN